jgi:hypothetical protein
MSFTIPLVLTLLALLAIYSYNKMKTEMFALNNINKFSAALQSEENRNVLGKVMDQYFLDGLIYSTDEIEEISSLIDLGADPKPRLLETIETYYQRFNNIRMMGEMIDDAKDALEEIYNAGEQNTAIDDKIRELERNIERWQTMIESSELDLPILMRESKVLLNGYLRTREEFPRSISSRPLSRLDLLRAVIYLNEIDEFDLLERLVRVDNLKKSKFTPSQQRKNKYAIDIIEDVRKNLKETVISSLPTLPTDISKMVVQY